MRPGQGRGVLFLVADNPHAFGLKHSKHPIKFVSATKNPPVYRVHAVRAVFAGLFGPLLDLIKGRLARPAVDAEQRTIRKRVERVVTPLTGGDHATIKAQQTIEFWTLEKHRASAHA